MVTSVQLQFSMKRWSVQAQLFIPIKSDSLHDHRRSSRRHTYKLAWTDKHTSSHQGCRLCSDDEGTSRPMPTSTMTRVRVDIRVTVRVTVRHFVRVMVVRCDYGSLRKWSARWQFLPSKGHTHTHPMVIHIHTHTRWSIPAEWRSQAIAYLWLTCGKWPCDSI